MTQQVISTELVFQRPFAQTEKQSLTVSQALRQDQAEAPATASQASAVIRS